MKVWGHQKILKIIFTYFPTLRRQIFWLDCRLQSGLTCWHWGCYTSVHMFTSTLLTLDGTYLCSHLSLFWIISFLCAGPIFYLLDLVHNYKQHLVHNYISNNNNNNNHGSRNCLEYFTHIYSINAHLTVW